MFNRIGATVVQQSARTREPPVGVRTLSWIADEGVTQPEGAARRVDELTSFEKTRMGTRARVGADGFFADQVGRGRETVEVFRLETDLPAREIQFAIGFGPRLADKCRSAACHCLRPTHTMLLA